ncbi:8042_t:CDS:2 [Entrophospora sp. SA101]|nr:8042_t:CDS:2 [Entrophospora sp. SA101]
MRNIKDRTSEDELHFQDGSILHVDACVGDIPIVLMEEKQLDAEVAKAKLDIYRKFHWPPHYKDLSFVIAIAFSGNIVIFNKLTCGKIYVDELHLNLSFVEDRVRCEIEPSSHWGSHITINYSSVLKVFFSINDLEIQRIQNFYVNNNIPFLETAIRNEIKKKVFHLELTPVGLPCSPSDLNTLQVAMYCFVHALLKVHQNGWSVIDLRCPNTIEFNGCYCIIDAIKSVAAKGTPTKVKVRTALDIEGNAPLESVQLDGLVVLKIIKHCHEFFPKAVTGQLLGLDVDRVLEVTNSFPFPEAKTDDEHKLVDELPIVIKNSHLVTALLDSLDDFENFIPKTYPISINKESVTDPLTPDFETLELSLDSLHGKNFEFLLKSIEDNNYEQNNFAFWQKNVTKAQSALQKKE